MAHVKSSGQGNVWSAPNRFVATSSPVVVEVDISTKQITRVVVCDEEVRYVGAFDVDTDPTDAVAQAERIAEAPNADWPAWKIGW